METSKSSIERGENMNRKEAIERLKGLFGNGYTEQEQALEMGIKALELIDTLTERPCEVCKHHKENGCCKWNCVFDGRIGDKK